MSFWDQVAADAAIFTDLQNGFGEAIVYTPFGGTPKPINANVLREQPADIAGASQTASPFTEIWIANNAITGVASVNVGGDTVKLASRQGGPTSIRQVDGVIDQDAGMWHLRLR